MRSRFLRGEKLCMSGSEDINALRGELQGAVGGTREL